MTYKYIRIFPTYSFVISQHIGTFVTFVVLPVLAATYYYIMDPDLTKMTFVVAEGEDREASTASHDHSNQSKFANIKGLKSVKKH